MELASLVAGEPWSDHPACVHPVLAAVARGVNDAVCEACRPRLGALVPRMIGTAARGTPDERRAYLDRSARITLRCAAAALDTTTMLGSEMESARRTARAVLARRHRETDPAGMADRTGRGARADSEDRGDPADKGDLADPGSRVGGTRVPRTGLPARLCVALLERAGLLDRLYPAAAAWQVAQAVALLQPPQCDRALVRLLQDCIPRLCGLPRVGAGGTSPDDRDRQLTSLSIAPTGPRPTAIDSLGRVEDNGAMSRPGKVRQLVAFTAVTLLVIALSPALVLAGEPCERTTFDDSLPAGGVVASSFC